MIKKISIKRLIKVFIYLIITFLFVIFLSNLLIKKSSEEFLYNDVSKIPHNKVGLVLGTSKRVIGGGVNMFFKYRMEAAKNLFDAGKIDYILISGDNSTMEYNETRDMKNYLVELNIPAEKIIEDYAGFRTLDSVIRANKVFGQDSITIISQEFHNERAVFIANNHDIYALGFNAQKVDKNYSLKTTVREYFARVIAVLDVYVLNTMPKFYKEKEDIYLD